MAQKGTKGRFWSGLIKVWTWILSRCCIMDVTCWKKSAKRNWFWILRSYHTTPMEVSVYILRLHCFFPQHMKSHKKNPSKRLMNVFQCIFVLNFTWWVEMWQKKQKQKSAGVQIPVHLTAVTKPQASGSCSSQNDPHYRLWVCDVNV